MVPRLSLNKILFDMMEVTFNDKTMADTLNDALDNRNYIKDIKGGKHIWHGTFQLVK